MPSRPPLPLPPAVSCHAEPLADRRPAAASFEALYAAYSWAEHFADAAAAYRSRALTPVREQGPGTWHEQVLAGRVQIRALREIGLGVLGAASRDHALRRALLIALTADDGPPLPPPAVREALVRPPIRRGDRGAVQDLLAQLLLVRWLGEEALELRHASGVEHAAGGLIRRRAAEQQGHDVDGPGSALSLAAYVDAFCGWGGVVRGRGKRRSPGAGYRDHDFEALLRDGITPMDAAGLSARGVSLGRAGEVIRAQPALSDGAL